MAPVAHAAVYAAVNFFFFFTMFRAFIRREGIILIGNGRAMPR